MFGTIECSRQKFTVHSIVPTSCPWVSEGDMWEAMVLNPVVDSHLILLCPMLMTNAKISYLNLLPVFIHQFIKITVFHYLSCNSCES